MSHTTGRTTFAKVKHNLRKKNPDGVEPSRIQMHKVTYTRKDDRIVDEASREIIDALDKKLEELPLELRNQKSAQDNIYVAVRGPELHGRVRGAGLGVKPSRVGLTPKNIEEKKKHDSVQARFVELEGQVSSLTGKLEEMDDLKAQVALLTQALLGRHSSKSSVHLSDN
ncbi:uncharacterized protein LOC122073357 isoform X2 [Macadamia integrifolia]|nr:uncharacterized protein LOC122073357 isoform X2 [Macadamia integrifolia]XP_042493871.1 uncharacterized protein LOC122073357 isoform X2 [Macadamia integrifolia]